MKVGIIGCGNISSAYFSYLKKSPVVEVTSCADLDFFRAEAKAEQYGVKPYTVQDLLAEKSIDIVINLTIPKAHAPVNIQILEAGKHAYCEKPFALDFAEGLKALETAKAVGKRVGCAPDTFLGGGIQTCRKLIDDGAIGEPVAAVANMAGHGHESWHPDPEFYYQAGGGPMLDMGPYYVTALVNLLGPVRRVTGSARASFAERTITSEKKRGTKIPVEVPTHYAGVFDFASGAIATLNMSFDVWAHNLPLIEIYGTEGTLCVPDPNGHGGEVLLRRAADKEWTNVPLTHPSDVGRGIGVADMAYAILSGRPHRASGELAFHVLEAMQAVELSSKTGVHTILQSTCPRPAAIPTGLPAGELDL